MKKFNKIKATAVLLLSLTFMLPALTPAYATESGDGADDASYQNIMNLYRDLQDDVIDLYDKVNSQPAAQVYEPLIKLLSPQTIEAEPGDTLDVVITVKNIGTSAAYNVLTQAAPPNKISVVFIDNTNNAVSIPENNTRAMTMTIKVASDIEPGTYAIDLNHSFKTKDQANKTSTDQLFVQVAGTNEGAPNIALGAFNADMRSIAPGGEVTLTAKIQNLGDGEATQVQLTYEPAEFADTVMTMADMISTSDPYYYPTMEAGFEDTVTFSFRASDDAKKGTYPISIKLSYRNEKKEIKEETRRTSITVSKDEAAVEKPNLEIRDMTVPTELYEVSENATIAFRIVNTGKGLAENIKITATPSDAAAVVPTSGSIQTVRSLAPNAEQVLNFSFAATEASKTQSYAIGFKVEYVNGEDDDAATEPETFAFDQYAYINVSNPEEEEDDPEGKTSKPKMIVSEYTVNPQVVHAGQEFDLDITFQNTSSTKSVENIKITLEALEVTEDKGSVFNPVGGSNTVFIDKMGIKEEAVYHLQFYTVNDAEARSYKLQVKFQYQDEDLNDYEEIEQLAINVKQTTQLEVTDLYLPTSAMVGEEVYIYPSIINSGKVMVSNLRVKVAADEGSDFDGTQASRYIGNVARGNSLNYDGTIKFTSPGRQSGTFMAYGEDDTGEPVEYIQEFTVEVADGGDMMDPGMMDPGMMDPGMEDPNRRDPGMTGEEPQGVMAFISQPIVWGSAIGVVALVIIIIIVVVRRKKKRIDFDE